MIDVGTLVMKVDADTKKFQKGLSVVNKGMASVGNAIKTAGKTMAIGVAAAGTAAGVLGVKALEMGADAEEMLNKYNVVFSGMTDTVDKWATEYAKSVGRSTFDTKEYLSNIADLQIGLGMTKDEAFDLSKKIVTLGTDLASFNNLQDDEAIDALSKAMLGEAESAKKLGLLLNVDRVKAYAEAQGLVWKEVTDAQKAQLVYNLALEQSENATGDAERSAESYTNQMKALKLSIKDSATELGMKLIPVATKLVRFINNRVTPNLDEWINKGFELFKNIKDYVEPIVGSLADFIQKNWPKMKQTAIDVFNGIKDSAIVAWDYFNESLLPIFNDVVTWVVNNWPQIKETASNVFDSVVDVIEPAIESIGSFVTAVVNSNFMSSFLLPGMEKLFTSTMGVIGTAVTPVIELIDTLTESIEGANAASEKGLLGKINSLLPEGQKIDLTDIFDLEELSKIILPISPIYGPGGGSPFVKIPDAPKKGATASELGVVNININGPVSSDRDARRTVQQMVDELKRKGVVVP